MDGKRDVVVAYGGRTAEHEVSCRSAAFIFRHLNRAKYNIHALAIDKDGVWWPQDFRRLEPLIGESAPVVREPLAERPWWVNRILPVVSGRREAREVVVFPIQHGTFGEDGTLQGLLDLADVAYVGPDTLGSAVGMNKVVAKEIAAMHEIPIVPYVAMRLHDRHEKERALAERIAGDWGYPVFVKPASLGSSVGITKVRSEKELAPALNAAFKVDEQVLVEKGLTVREIEFAALGSYDADITTAGEVVPPDSDFYTYEAKYSQQSTAKVVIPAPLEQALVKEGRELAARIFQALQLHGMARIDLFLEKGSNRFYFNEVNTIPGFTSISQYPQLWKHMGVSGGELLDRLLEQAVDRWQTRRLLQRTR